MMKMTKNNVPSPASVLKRLRSRSLEVAQNAMAYADKKNGYEASFYEALFAIKAPPKEAYLASAIEQVVKATNAVGQEVVKRIKTDPNERVALIIVTPPELHCRPGKVNLDVRVPRKIKGALKKCAIPNAIGMTRFLHRPRTGEPGFEAYLQLAMLVYGPSVSDEVGHRLEKLVAERFPADRQTVMTWEIIENDSVSLYGAAARVFDLADQGANSKAARIAAKSMGITNWTKSRRLREFLRLQALSSVPFKALLVAHGDGERLADSAVNEGRHALRGLAKGPDQVIHRDQISQFHASELVRLGKPHVRLPFLKIR